MKLSGSKFVILFTYMCLMSAYSEIHVEGRWISTRIDNADDNGIGEGWVVVFRPDGTFSEEIDEGFGLVEEWEGTYSLKDEILSMQRSSFNHAWDFRIRKNEEILIISRMWKDEIRYTVFLKQSDEEHPELAKLPKWPKSKEEAVSILKQKLKEEDLNKLADGTRDALAKYHFGLGMYIRNAFGVWRGNKELWDDLTGGEKMHPDALVGYYNRGPLDRFEKTTRKLRGISSPRRTVQYS